MTARRPFRCTRGTPMKPIGYAEGYRYGNPNLRWGDPSYLLQPGNLGRAPHQRRTRYSLLTDPTTPNLDAVTGWDNSLVTIYQTALTHV